AETKTKVGFGEWNADAPRRRRVMPMHAGAGGNRLDGRGVAGHGDGPGVGEGGSGGRDTGHARHAETGGARATRAGSAGDRPQARSSLRRSTAARSSPR